MPSPGSRMLSDHSNDTPRLEDIGVGPHTVHRRTGRAEDCVQLDDVARSCMVDTLPSALIPRSWGRCWGLGRYRPNTRPAQAT